jgi:hypothetical protein
VADLELREEEPLKEVDKGMSRKEEVVEKRRKEEEEEEEEELYQIPRHPVPVGIGKKIHIFCSLIIFLVLSVLFRGLFCFISFFWYLILYRKICIILLLCYASKNYI